MKVITPSPGRVVWYRPRPNDSIYSAMVPERPLAAIVAYVWHDRLVNLTVFDVNGLPHSRTSVPFRQPDDEAPSSSYCEWMPYQIGQAAKAESAVERAERMAKEVDRLRAAKIAEAARDAGELTGFPPQGAVLGGSAEGR